MKENHDLLQMLKIRKNHINTSIWPVWVLWFGQRPGFAEGVFMMIGDGGPPFGPRPIIIVINIVIFGKTEL